MMVPRYRPQPARHGEHICYCIFPITIISLRRSTVTSQTRARTSQIPRDRSARHNPTRPGEMKEMQFGYSSFSHVTGERELSLPRPFEAGIMASTEYEPDQTSEPQPPSSSEHVKDSEADARAERGPTLACPKGFLQQVLRKAATRSGFFKHQLECLPENGYLVMSAEVEAMFRDWYDCIWYTSAELQATRHAKLVRYLNVAEFFQDPDEVDRICKQLACRVFKPHGGDGSSAKGNRDHKEHAVKVLEGLSDDLTMKVLHSTPGCLEEHMLQLPSHLQSLAAMAHCSSLAAACCPATQYSDPSAGRPLVTLCVDTRQAAAELGIEQDLAPSIDMDEHASFAAVAAAVAGASMWPVAAEVNTANVNNGLFSLERKPGSIACCLLARTLQDNTIVLPDTARLVFGPSNGDVHVRNVTFQGGGIVCMGSSCSLVFHDCVFKSCNVVVIAGAQAIFNNAQFQNMASCTAQVSVYACGDDTMVEVKGGTFIGGLQGATVQAGACLEASDLTITGMEVTGVEGRDEGSLLKLTRCKLHEFSDQHGEWQTGVQVHHRSCAHLSSVNITGMSIGVLALTHASAALVRCTVSDCLLECVKFRSAATGRLDRCTLSGSKRRHGLCVADAGSCVHADGCNFLGSLRHCGAVAVNRGTLTADACTSSGNRNAGYTAFGEGSLLELTNCSSNGDRCGCTVVMAAKLTARRVVFTASEESGCRVESGGGAVLLGCTATNCGDHGLYAQGTGSRVRIECCTLQQNRKQGVLACDHATVQARDCSFAASELSGCKLMSGASAMLRGCTAATCGTQGVLAQGEGTRVEMECCKVQKNFGYGVLASTYAMVQARDCIFSNNQPSDYKSKTGALVKIIQTSSDGDKGRGRGLKRRLVDI